MSHTKVDTVCLFSGKAKVEFLAAHTMKAYRGAEVWLHLFLISALEMETTGYLHAQGALPWYPLSRKLGGPQSRADGFGEKKSRLPLRGLEHHSVSPEH